MEPNREIQKPVSAGPRAISRARRLAFACTAVVSGLLVLEVAARIRWRQSPNARWQQQGDRVHAIGFPRLNDILAPDPVRFWRLREGITGQRIRGLVAGAPLDFVLSTDARGLRRTPSAGSGRPTILFLGDSCLMGIGVNDDQTVPAAVQRLMPEAACLNAGVPGYSAYQGRMTLSELGPALRPNIVVIGFGFNDDQCWDDVGDREQGRRIARLHDEWTQQFGITRVMRLMMSRHPRPAPSGGTGRPRLTDEEFVSEIDAMVKWCRSHGAVPVLVAWPLRVQMESAALTGKQAALLAYAARHEVACVNLVEAFRAEFRSDLFVDVIHAGPAGCARAAEAIVRAIPPR